MNMIKADCSPVELHHVTGSENGYNIYGIPCVIPTYRSFYLPAGDVVTAANTEHLSLQKGVVVMIDEVTFIAKQDDTHALQEEVDFELFLDGDDLELTF